MLVKDQYQLLLESAHELLGKAIADRHKWAQIQAGFTMDKSERFFGTSARHWVDNIVSTARAIVHIGKACSEPVVTADQYYDAEEARAACSD